jgi:hypothetical protein
MNARAYENPHHQPWTVRKVEGLWVKVPGKPMGRNDALWAQLWAEREPLLQLATAYRLAAEADGWVFRPTYYGHEPMEQAFTGDREGFTLSGLCRPGKPDKEMPSAVINIYGPDRLAIEPPLIYDMEEIRRRLRWCGYCDAEDVDIVSVGFAGRVCLACEPRVRLRVETPGWCS